MRDHFTTLWTKERRRRLEREGDRGPIEVIFGGPHISQPNLDSVKIGDVIYPVLVDEGRLIVAARLEIEARMDPRDFVRSRLGFDAPQTAMWDELYAEVHHSHPAFGHRFPTTCCEVAAAGSRGSDIRFDRSLPGKLLGQIRLGPRPGREAPLRNVEGGFLKNHLGFHGHVRRLSAASAVEFEALFA